MNDLTTNRRISQRSSTPIAIPPRAQWKTGILAALAAVVLAVPASAATSALSPSTAKIVQNYGRLPLRFEANQGQSDPRVKFLSRGAGYSLFLASHEAVLSLQIPVAGDPQHRMTTDVVRMQLVGSDPQAEPAGIDRLPGVANYLIGVDPGQWHRSVPSYSRVRYRGVYPGVDLVYYGNQQQLEYDFVVAAGADPGAIRLHFDGAKELQLDASGNLVIVAADGNIAFHKPVVYQTVNGKRVAVSGRFTLLAGNTAAFALGGYDRGKPLVIDPTLVYSTFLGGTTSDIVSAIAVDSAGAAYLTGVTSSANFPTTPGVIEATDKSGRTTAFVTKLNASGSALIYSTFLGGTGSSSGGDSGESIAVDSSGNAYITGTTRSTDFPVTTSAYQKTNKAAAASGSTGYVAKLNPSGTALVYSTYLGGSRSDSANALVIDSAGDVYVAGSTYSSDFPATTGVFQTTNRSAASDGWNEFVTKLNPAGSALIYSTYLGGSDDYGSPNGMRLAVDSSGEAIVSGISLSTDFPTTTGAYQTTKKAASGRSDMTVAKLNATATKLIYGTYLGGSSSPYGDDSANGLAVDGAGNAYLGGVTHESDFPVTTGAFQTTSAAVSTGASAGFVTKINAAGTALLYSTYLGGSGGNSGDGVYGIAVDSSGDAYVTGTANSTDFPVTANAYQSVNKAAFNNGSNVFLSEFNPSGTKLGYSTYFGGANSFSDTGYQVVLGKSGAVYFAGFTGASDFPVTAGAFDTAFSSSNFTLGFIAEINLGSAPATLPTITTLSSNENPATKGANLIFSASVVPSTGTGVPTGNVVFSVDEANVATVALNASGYASYSTSSLAYGPHAILASYAGSTTYSASGGGITENIVPNSPVISPAAGPYPSAVLVSITDTTSGTTLYYTTDSTTPTTSSTKYTAPFMLSAPGRVEAIAVLSGAPNSTVTSATYEMVTAPTALAVPASPISTTTATLNGLVSTYGMAGTYYFAYGPTTALALRTPKTSLAPSLGGISFPPVPVSAGLTSLTSKTTYYYQVIITTNAGMSSGAVLSFTTH